MGHCKAVVLLALSVLCLTNAYKPIPKEKEHVYKYRALVKAGTTDPQSHASEFYLVGKVHMQDDGKTGNIKFEDMKYMVYNGERYYGHEYEIQKQPLPKEAEDLLKPFKIVYDDNLQVKGIVTDKQEKTFARNMHKAFAALLQLDMRKIDWEAKTPTAFMSEEHSVYGKTVASYNIVPSPEEFMIKKMHEMKSTKPMYQSIVSTINPEYCEATYEEPMSHDSHQVYIIKKHGEHRVIDYLESTGSVYAYPFQAKSESQYVTVNMTLQFEGIVPVKTNFEISNPQMDESLVYQMVDSSVEPTTFNDIMVGRRNTDMKKFIPVVEKMLTEMRHYLHKNPLHTGTPDVKHGQLINRVVRMLSFFDKETLEHMYETISVKPVEKEMELAILHQVLPLVGTHASVLFVKKIIHEKKVEDSVAIHMLDNLPGRVNVPTERMLHDMEGMLSWGDEINVHVRHSAILSFASLIHRTFHFQLTLVTGQHHHHHHGHEAAKELEHINFHIGGMNYYYRHHDTVMRFTKEHEVYNKYVETFFNKMKSAHSFATKLVYMNALYNTRLPTVLDHLLPIVKGEMKVEPKLRFGALFAISPMVLGDSEMVFEIYWPIFSNWSERLEIRALAYRLIMESHPPITRLLNIQWQMSVEPSTELQHYHYSYLTTMSRSTDPCHRVTRLNAAQILKFARKPQHYGYSFTNHVDYLDRKFGFGGDMETAMFSTNDTKIFKLKLNSQMFNVRSNLYEFYFKIDGLKDDVYDKFYLDLDSTTHMFSYHKVLDFFKSIVDHKDVSITITIGNNNRITRTYYFEGEHLKDIEHIFSLFFEEHFTNVKNTISIHYDMFTRMVLPTDIGMPVVWEILMPALSHNHVNTKKDVTNNLINFHFDNKYHIARHTRYGLSFYNPIADVWQGVNRYISYDFVVPLYMDMTINYQQGSIKMSMKRHKEHDENVMGLRSHVTTMTFVKDDLKHGVLEQSCSKCHHMTIATKRDEHRHNYTLFDIEGYNTGSKYHAEIYDSEYPLHYHEINHNLRRFAGMDNKHFDNPIEYLFDIVRHFRGFMIIKPRVGTHGFLLTVSPSTEQPVSQIDFTFRINREYAHEKDQFLPGMKFNTRFTWALKNKESSVKTWDVNAIIDLNQGHTMRNTKIDVTRIIPGQKDYKVCMEYLKKWTESGVNSHFVAVMGKSADGKCDKNDPTVEINMVGEQLDEQKSHHHIYAVCNPYTHVFGIDYHSLECAAQHTSVRKYVYDIKTSNNMPTEFKKMFYSIINRFKVLYKHESMSEDEIEDKVTEENHLKVKVDYPIDVQHDEMNMEFVTPSYAFRFTGIPSYHLSYFGFYPDNTHYSKLYMLMHHMGMMHTCVAHHDKVQHEVSERKHYVSFEIPHEWTLYVGDSEKDAHHGIYLKKMDNGMIALKAVHGSEVVEIYPEGKHGEHFKILVNGKEVSDAVDFHTEKWFAFLIRPHMHSIVLTTFHFHLHVEHKADHVIIQVPNVHDYKFHGQCVYHY